MNMPAVGVSLRMPPELWARVNAIVEDGTYKDFSEATRKLIEAGLWVNDHKDDIQDPEKANKIIQEWNAKMNEKEILDIPKQFTDDQIRALEMAFELEKERRCKL